MPSAIGDEKIKVAIVGGGIGGVVAAIGLLRYPHIDVHVYESSPCFATIGAGISIGANGFRALELVSPKARQALADAVTHNLYEEHRDYFFAFRLAEDTEGKDIDVVRGNQGLVSFHRSKLLNSLASLLPKDAVSFDKKIQTIEQEGETATLHFADGTTATADCVIGADGIHSPTREHVVADLPETYAPAYTGIHVYRALIPMDEARAEIGDDLCSRGFIHMSQQTNRMAVTYPIDGHKIYNVAVLDMTKTEQRGAWAQPPDYARVDALFKDWAPTPRRLAKLVQREGTAEWAVHDVPDLPSFVRGRVALLGDAAHAMTPSLGAGASQAIEDAAVLAAVLGRVTSAREVRPALRAYDAVRRPEAQSVRRQSRLSSSILSMASSEFGADVGKIIAKSNENVHGVWNRDVVGEVSEATRVFDAFKQ